MTFEEKLANQEYDRIWQEYCGFLDLDMESYMRIQRRLLEEQIRLWSSSPLGQKILKGRTPSNVEEFRSMVPLTTYEDYADVLLLKKEDMLPDKPIIWLQTTWEGGKHPIKVAPYTNAMLETYKNNIITCLMMATSKGRGSFDISIGDTFLYGLAPLPYITGLIPLGLQDQFHMEFLPPVNEAVNMTFSERNKKGFKMGLIKGIDFFFGMGSVAYYVSMSIASLSEGGRKGGSSLKKLFTMPPNMAVKFLKAKKQCQKENRQLMPKDLFKLKGFLCAGTDNRCYKDDLEELWGVRPVEVFAGTEPSFVGTETWNRNGLYFFPDACFYEFMPQDEMYRNMEDPSYAPKTVCMDQVVPGEVYELVLTVLKGGAFARYRVGDMYRCLGLASKEDDTRIPRFEYIDRVPDIIDIAGFTRISENSIKNVIELSGLEVAGWVALKEFTPDKGRPYLHMYVELAPGTVVNRAVSRELLKEHLTIYFKYVDQDYQDLKRILGMDPLEITVLRCGTFKAYKERAGKTLRHINPSIHDVQEMVRMQEPTNRQRRY
ncbi:GH3 family domain-containing protein [Enterocloster citroniae]|uniref:GH3 family domain-containing protein n=1 Tax=Enterocloster citroniae TaxID=358743 RepID=UPI00349EBCC3